MVSTVIKGRWLTSIYSQSALFLELWVHYLIAYMKFLFQNLDITSISLSIKKKNLVYSMQNIKLHKWLNTGMFLQRSPFI